MNHAPRSGTVDNEGCEIRYWYQGSGPLLIMIPGGGGVGRTYFPIFAHMSHRFTMCTLDRRQAGSSYTKHRRPLNPSQQVRDVISVMQALDFAKTSLFGNSGGGIIAFHFAAIHPELLDCVVSHEAPTSLLLPDCGPIQDSLFTLLAKADDEGTLTAFKDFRAMQKGFDGFPVRITGSKDDINNFLDYEFLAFALYCPDLRRVRENGVAVAVASGSMSEDAWYARATLQQSKILDCRHYLFPGNHAGFELDPIDFAVKLMEVLQNLR